MYYCNYTVINASVLENKKEFINLKHIYQQNKKSNF